MSFFPPSEYAEDQPFAHAIAISHVLSRALTTGSILGLALTPIRNLFPALRPTIKTSSSSSSSPTRGVGTTSGPHSLTDKFLLNASDFSILALGATSIGFVVKMWGKELIEWQDKSWFLRNTPVVVQMDDWTYAGMVGGALAAVVAGKASSKSLGWRGLVGAVGIGSIWGTAVFFAWKGVTGWEDF